MKPSLCLAGLLLVAIWALAQSPQVIDFRGVPLGATEAEWTAKIPAIRCETAPAPLRRFADRHCEAIKGISAPDVLQFGGVTARGISAAFLNDRLIAIQVGLLPAEHASVVAALSEKFGPPTRTETPEFRTRGGAITQNSVATWAIGDGTIVAKKYASTLDSSSVSYSDARGAAELESRAKEAAKRGAGSL